MDISFKTDEGRFNYRVCAIIIHNNKLLAMHDENVPYYYLPGGRVTLHETAEDAVLREVKEELQVDAKIIRPLWVNQSFFNEDVSLEDFHEICMYYLLDIAETGLLDKGDQFEITEGSHRLKFEWLPFEQLNDKYLYPDFIKEHIFKLPPSLAMITEHR